MPQGTPWKARWSQWAEEGAANKSGSASMWCVGVSVGDLVRTWRSVVQDSLIPLQGPGPKALETGPQRPGTVMDTSLLIGRAQGVTREGVPRQDTATSQVRLASATSRTHYGCHNRSP